MKSVSGRVLAGSAAAAIAVLLLTGCGAGDLLSSDDPDPAPVDEASVDPLADALAIGDTFDGASSTTLQAVVRRAGDESWVPSRDGYEWLSLTVRTCVPAGGSPTEVGWYQWAATGSDGGWYSADLDYDGDRPAPKYPKLEDLAPGSCAEGRVLIDIPQGAELVTLVNADRSGEPQGTWLLGDAGEPTDTDRG